MWIQGGSRVNHGGSRVDWCGSRVYQGGSRAHQHGSRVDQFGSWGIRVYPGAARGASKRKLGTTVN